MVHDRWWYQTFRSSLLVVDSASAAVIKEVTLGEPGVCGPAVDLAVMPEREIAWVVIEDDEVIELSLAAPASPSVARRMSAASLSVLPRRLSVVGGECYLSGLGGVARLSDGRVIFARPHDDVGRVAMSDLGLVACVGRHAQLIDDDRYVGSASDLQPLPSDLGIAGGLAFVRQGDGAALVGLMSPNLRELDASHATTAAAGTVHSIRVIDGLLWIVSEEAISGHAIKPGSLHPVERGAVIGARDVARLDDNHLAVAGTFGRAIYRIADDSRGAGDTFTNVHREPGRLSVAVSDGQHILAGSTEGTWMYLIGSRAELTTRTFQRPPAKPPVAAVTISASARIADDGRSVAIVQNEAAQQPLTHSEGEQCLIHTVASVDGDFWIGHDRGITVLRARVAPASKKTPAIPSLEVAGRLRIPGPVRHIYPLLAGGGASYVSEFGGFGVARWIDEPIRQ